MSNILPSAIFAFAPFSSNLRCKSIKICPVRFFTVIAIFAPKFTTERAATRRVTGLYLSTAADKARQRPWRRPPGSKAARQAGDRLVTPPRRGFAGPQGPHGCDCHGAIKFEPLHSLKFFLEQILSFINVFFTFLFVLTPPESEP